MKVNPMRANVGVLVCVLVALQSCKDNPTAIPEESKAILSALSRDLPASQLMQLEGITSLHYVLYDSSAGFSGGGDSSFIPLDEYFIDSSHVKNIQYFGANHYWYVSVYDSQRDTAWYYQSGQVTCMQLPSVAAVVQQSIQAALGSMLRLSSQYLRSEYIDGKLCDLFADSLGNQEWVWRDHRLPIQERVLGSLQISTTRKVILEINTTIPDSVFEPPK